LLFFLPSTLEATHCLKPLPNFFSTFLLSPDVLQLSSANETVPLGLVISTNPVVALILHFFNRCLFKDAHPSSCFFLLLINIKNQKEG